MADVGGLKVRPGATNVGRLKKSTYTCVMCEELALQKTNIQLYARYLTFEVEEVMARCSFVQ
jgi:hypothetical protein